MIVLEKRKQKSYTLDAKEISPDSAKALSSALAKRIVGSIKDHEKYPKQIAQELKTNEQKVYYHIRNLARSGIIKETKQEQVQGATARFFKLSEPALVIKFRELSQSNESKISDEEAARFLSPFVIDGRLNALVVVGSPEPHGPDKARSRDGFLGIDLALFFGSFLSKVDGISVRLDTEMRESDFNENLILIGGPIVNKATERFNSSLPVQFTGKKDIYSKLSKTTYSSDETGIIVKAKNPFNPEKQALVVAGKRYSGTRAAIIALIQSFHQVCAGNKFNRSVYAKVVEGLDLDSDGTVDAVEFRE